ncbi:MAG: 2Fe-2S iron-sulfur cluster binding domain-containing protein [Candidatus Aminicenantes bacterium]|nr:2Fe-2S iron-sulfur cluster binding domain-containing protein [Candidatus Aminicenantes bacterium]
MAKQSFTLNVNGKDHRVRVEPDEPLLWVLRDNLRLTGSKFGCGVGICGACSVLIDGVARRSCCIQVANVSQGQKIITIEGLGTLENLLPLQKAFVDYTAFCCGFCTPGMIITATALLARNPSPSREEIIQAMDHNLCRCGSYINIIEAIESFVKDQRGEKSE